MFVKFSRLLLVAATCTALVPITSATMVSHAQNIEELIASMETISTEAGAKNEEVKQLEIDLETSGQEVAELSAHVAQATDQVNAAIAEQEAYRFEVNRIASAKYRGATIDPLTNAISAENPQNALDRAAYMTLLGDKANSALAQLTEAREEAVERRGELTRAKARAQLKQLDLEERKKELHTQQEELEAKAREIQEKVSALGPAERALWEAKNGPVEYSLAGVSGSNAAGMEALTAAMTKLGSPYSWGGIGPDAFDCSGLVYWAYQQQGKTLPRTSQAQMAGGTPVSRAELQPGDVVGYYPGATHVGIYAGNGMLIHASDYGIPVQVVPVDSMPFYGARRY
ncbi:NlpC/P60 family protein [Corynebacterium sp. 153RC1]|uniref:NlpC/P60 family protein n=2 Tax=unclassified Corynebacterium TaxID=2624378 RepID=UPI00211BB96C|nr:NlpC/P60 family protein [Corynebacterium sp. 209RC1]MCQ9354339.1 NlpC/P60 family protein [Corynebacterium sp. 1222RC1]MCQ9356621.1 NlpC/P60 family protein [Corynebacterium sp. 122RC1]MCQ9359631.1 NlpC/P60 family protein [Corynebacterium sp. 142RC1]MCQ9360573.1 NlpC/P60 family protein [Corynebacterium sp. 153RC1]MCQ9362565.1 NlpC/P60 family protein [Corynebacterium sp. 732RC1]MCQ9365776.1 NlpC/P60 family protein [Corynebacterium sp. 70RC1]MCQ9369826.1 NlpC/P60 family protein [Corynebacteri